MFVISFHVTYCTVGNGELDVEAFCVTIIPLPELMFHVVDPIVDVIIPPLNIPVYKLDSNQRKRVTLAYPLPFWLKYKSCVDPLT